MVSFGDSVGFRNEVDVVVVINGSMWSGAVV